MSKEGDEQPQNNQEKDKNAEIFENRKKHKQLIRVITVMAYMFAVSPMGMTLSGYYLFIWQPPNSKLISHVRNPVRQIAESPLDLSPPLPMALKYSPIEEPVILTRSQKNRTYSTPKPPTHDFESFVRAKVEGGIFLKKLVSRNVVVDQVSTATDKDVNDTLVTTGITERTNPSEESTLKAGDDGVTIKHEDTILSKLLRMSSTSKMDGDERETIEVESSIVAGKILGATSVPEIDDEDKNASTLRQ